MAFNRFSYTMLEISKATNRAALGIKGGLVSPDGKYIIVDRGPRPALKDSEHDKTIAKPAGLPPTYKHLLGRKLVDSGRVDGGGKPIMVWEKAFEDRPLTNNHPRYDNAQAAAIKAIWYPDQPLVGVV